MSVVNDVLAGKPLSCEVIDAHTHLAQYTASGWYQYQPELDNSIRMMDRLGIDTIVTAPHPLIGSYCEKANAITAEAIKRYPGRVLGYVCFNPVYGVPEARKLTRKYLDRRGFVGFKFLPGYHGTLLADAYAYGFGVANERRLAVLCHKWGESPSTAEFRTMAEKYPDLSLLIGHGGGNRNTYLACAKLCADFPNVFIEICGGLGCDLWLEDIVAAAGAERIIFGTDMVNLDPRNDLGRVVFADIPEADKHKILAGNFRKILGRRRK